MDTEASRGLGYAGVPGGTSSKNRLKSNEGRRLKTNRYKWEDEWLSNSNGLDLILVNA